MLTVDVCGGGAVQEWVHLQEPFDQDPDQAQVRRGSASCQQLHGLLLGHGDPEGD